MKDPCISFGYLLEPCLFFRILFQFLAFKKVIEFCKNVATMQNFTPKKGRGAPVHLRLCKGVKKYPEKGHMKTMVGVCVFLAKT